MIKKEHKINPIPNYIDITKVDITKWEDGLYTLGLDKDKGLVILEKPIYSSTGDGSRALYDDGTYKPTYDKEGIDKLLEGLEQTQNDNLKLIKDLENNIKGNKGNININKESIEALKDANKVYDKIIETLKSDIKENYNNIININKSITDLNEKLVKGTADINEVNEAIFKINNKIIAINKKIEELQTNVNIIKSNIINIEKDISSIKFKIESIDKNYKLADQKIIDDYKKAVGTLREEVRTADNEIIKAYKEADQKIYTKLDSDIKEEVKIREETDKDIIIQHNIDKAETLKEIKDLKETLTNINSGPVGTAEGTSVINLPENVRSSITPSYKFEGLTLNQLIENGDFRDIVSDNSPRRWYSPYSDYLETKDGILKTSVKSNSEANRIETVIPYPKKGNKYYIRGAIKPKYNTATYILYGGSSISKGTLIPNKYNILSGIIKAKLDDSNKYFLYHNTSKDTGYKEKDEVHYCAQMCIDLTSSFGAGNEPTKEWCDEHIQGYFDGTKSVTAPLRIKSEIGGRNLFSKIHSPQGSWYDNNNTVVGSAGDSFSVAIKIGGGGNYTINFDDSIPLWRVWYIKDETILGAKTFGWVNQPELPYVINVPEDATYIMVQGSLLYNNEFIETLKVEKGNKATPWTPAPEDNQPATGSTLYINNNLELKSIGTVKDYIENGKLYKNVDKVKDFKPVYSNFGESELKDGVKCIKARIKRPDKMIQGFKEQEMCLFKNITHHTGKTAVEYLPWSYWTNTSESYLDFQLPSGTTKEEFEKRINEFYFVLEETEVINLDTTGQITNHPNGTIFIEPITNKTAYYNKGLDISDYNIKEIEYMQIFEENSYQDLDISKIEIKDNILTHPDIESGIVFISYYYDNTPIYSSNTVDYYNLDNTLKSPDGSIWKKVYEIDNEGKITLKGEKI